MPPLPEFTDNPLVSRDNVVRAALALLRPLDPHKSPACARIRLATGTGAGFSDTSAQLEGFARPLWVIPDLLTSSSSSGGSPPPTFLKSWIAGLRVGTDPLHQEYWGDLSDVDQRMVEMESIAFALLKVEDLGILGLPSSSSPPPPPESHGKSKGVEEGEEEEGEEEKLHFRDNLVAWLSQINNHAMPPNNWRWFRVFVNLALMRVRGLSFSDQGSAGYRDNIARDFEVLDSFYIDCGWSSDGAWGNERKQVDYYSGSFAMQFAQLLFVRFAPTEMDPRRVERYRVQAGQFGASFWRYFDGEGAAIPFGRSMTYRFAFAAFWSAAALAHIQLPLPLDSPGAVKGMLLRHLRWWAGKSDIFNTDGTLNIGFTYPNMFLSEDYNSPQSVYWCLKTFVVLGLPGDDPFWTCQELPYPEIRSSGIRPNSCTSAAYTIRPVELVWPPRQILCNTPQHIFLLSAGQSTRKNHRSREAKYSKLAYSSAFGFSVPAAGASLLEQLAPDSTLCASFDGGETWSARWEPVDVRVADLQLDDTGQRVPTLLSCWYPRSLLGDALTIETAVIPPLEDRWPGWHLRIHRVRLSNEGANILSLIPRHLARDMVLHDSGFAISTQTPRNDSVFEMPILDLDDADDTSVSQTSLRNKPSQEHGCWKGAKSCLIVSGAGASGIADLTESCLSPSSAGSSRSRPVRESYLIKADANTNLIAPRTMMPSLRLSGALRSAANDAADGHGKHLEWTFVTGVFAVSSIPVEGDAEWSRLWEDKPSLDLSSYVDANFT